MMSNPSKLFLAGGFIRSVITGDEVQDIDLFATTKAEAERIAGNLVLAIDSNCGQSRRAKLHTTDNAYTILSHLKPIQIIHRWTFETPEQCAESFDFTIAKAAMWFTEDRWHSTAADTYYSDLAARRLVYTSPVRNEEAGGSLIRVLKFYQRGYRIPLESLAAVLARLEKGLDDTKLNLALQLTPGMEREFYVGQVFTGLLREVDPLAIPADCSYLGV
jgi:hypothetical protein